MRTIVDETKIITIFRTVCDECGKSFEFPPTRWWESSDRWITRRKANDEYRHDVLLIRDGWIINKTIDFKRCDFCCQKCYEQFMSHRG